MSHIPASKMPHAKPHDEHDDHHEGADAKPLTGGPEIKPQDDRKASEKPDAKPGKGDGDHGATPYVAIAAVGALAIGGIVAALALRRPEPPHKAGKDKPKPKQKGKDKPKGSAQKDRDED